MNLTHTHRDVPRPLPIGTPTPWGEIKAVHWDGFERHYMMVDERGVVSHFPDFMVREALESRA